MKKIFLVAVFLTAGLIFQAKATTDLYGGGRFGFFYSSLAPYGHWIELDYGLTVWKPNIIRASWSPYRYGQWIWTADGWYWDSDEPFGWAVYHYGRWYFDDYYGWIWIPDDQWSPAWVEWRYDNDYIGWSPLPPYANFSVSIGIHFSINFFTPYNHWHFVKYNYFCSPHVSRYYIGQNNVNHFFSKTKYRTNYGFRDGRVVNNGVDVDIIRQRTGQNIVRREITTVSNPRDLRNQSGNRNEVRSYIASREELSRGNAGNVEIQRADRNSTLQTSRIEMGRREVNRTDFNQNNIERNREIVPRVEGRDNEIPNRDLRNQNESPDRGSKTIIIEKRNQNQSEVNRENNRESRPSYIPQREVQRPQVQREPSPQRTERSSNSRESSTESRESRR